MDETEVAWDGRCLRTLLALRPDGAPACWRSTTRNDANRNQRIFGGQLLGQALAAALATMDGNRRPASLQVNFLRGADPALPLRYHVTTLQQGRRYASRRVEGRQGDQVVISAQVSAAVAVDGPPPCAHGPQGLPDVPPPEALPRNEDLPAHLVARLARSNFRAEGKPTIDMRLVAPETQLAPGPGASRLQYWVRARSPLPDDPALHGAALAYLSDFWLTFPALAHRITAMPDRPAYVASVSHSMWFMAPCRADGWLLVDSRGQDLGGGRALARAQVFDRDGREVLALAQECAVADRL